MQNRKYFTPSKLGKTAKITNAYVTTQSSYVGYCVIRPKLSRPVEAVKPGRFRMTSEELSAISKKGAELLLNATPEDMNNYRKWQ
jgi:hypothetical protein